MSVDTSLLLLCLPAIALCGLAVLVGLVNWRLEK